ncbi:CDGSH iron-sulfur domain-containing protein [Nannocystaceae bacterium ST9]
MSDNPIKLYPGRQTDVTWDSRLCIHVGECGRADNPLFEGGRNPWCQPDQVAIEDVVDVVNRCPTGALNYLHKDGAGAKAEQAPERNTLVVTNNGPLYLRGELAIEGAAEDMQGVKFRAALCRCGQSSNKPFCDNSHEQAGFRDRGAVGAHGTGLTSSGGLLEIRRAKNGPLLVSGNLTIVAASGREAWQGTRAALCRCGQSNNKPFCDGAHKAAGFTAD